MTLESETTPGVEAAPGVAPVSTAQEEQTNTRVSSRQSEGSYNDDDPDRPRWDRDTRLVAVFDYHHPDGRYAYSKLKGERADGEKTFLTGRRLGGNTLQIEKAESPRDFYAYPGLTNYLKGAGKEPDLLYRAHDLHREMAARLDEPVFICEGEKDSDSLWAIGLMATTNPNGAGKWKPEFSTRFHERDVVILPDNDERGRSHAEKVAASVQRYAPKSLKIVLLHGLGPKEDVSDWLEGKTREEFLQAVNDAGASAASEPTGRGVTLDDFYAFMPAHNYIFAPSRESWPATSVNSRIPPQPLVDAAGRPVLNDDGEQVRIPANKWLDQHRPVEQMTWAPGEPLVIVDRLTSEGGWIDRPGCAVFNQYRPPAAFVGDPDKAGPWVDHLRAVYPDEAEHIMDWAAHRIQKPEEKVNHALVFGGAPGIGKDSILHPLKQGVGHWNWADVSPKHLLGRFNGFV